jgi:hypothetical protein
VEPGAAGDGIGAVAEATRDRAGHRPDERAVTERGTTARGDGELSDAIGFRLQGGFGVVVLGDGRAQRNRLGVLGTRGGVVGASLLRGDVVELALVVGCRGAGVVGDLLLCGQLLLLGVELRLQPRYPARIVLALVGEASEVVLALDQLTGPVGAAEQSDHRFTIAAPIEQHGAAAHIVACRVELRLGCLHLRGQRRRGHTEPVDGRLRRRQPFVRRRQPGGDVAE